MRDPVPQKAEEKPFVYTTYFFFSFYFIMKIFKHAKSRENSIRKSCEPFT